MAMNRQPAGIPFGGQFAPGPKNRSLVSLDAARSTNLYGALTDVDKMKIDRLITYPSQDSWNGAHSLIIDGAHGTTLWLAVAAVDADFPRLKPHGGDWPKIPDAQTVLAALRWSAERDENTELPRPDIGAYINSRRVPAATAPPTKDEFEDFARRMQDHCGGDQSVYEAIETLRWAAEHHLGWQ